MGHRLVGALLFLLVCSSACSDDGGGGGPADAGVDAASGLDPLRADCEPLVPSVCGMPFPSSWFLTEDSATETGYHVTLGETTLPQTRGAMRHYVQADLSDRDGFSVNAAPLAHLPGATATGLPRADSIERSLEAGSPTVLLNADTGERVPHWSELDMSTRNPESRALIVRPVVPLAHATRYIVAVRHVVDEAGADLEPAEVFRALRDGEDHEHPYVAARRDDFEDIFAKLGEAGVARDDLQLAWDFVTASEANDTAWMLHVRDQALAVVGEDGPDFVIDSVEEAPDEHTWKQIEGRMTVPLYLTNAEPGGRLNLGAGGMPVQNGTMELPFLVIIPLSATGAEPAPPIQYGHGLLGTRYQMRGFRRFLNEKRYVGIAVDWIGMSEVDVPEITLAIATGELDDFRTVPDRLIQGVVGALLSMRMMRGGFAGHEVAQDGTGSVVDTSAGYYYGASQGGIFGATYMSLSTDVQRGILAVPGQPYNLLLNRSVDFDPYLTIMRTTFFDGADIQLGLALIQQFWDRAEPGSFSRHVRTDTFPGTEPHDVMLLVALGDHQVTPLGAHVMARAITGVPNITPANRTIWGIDDAPAPHTGSGMIEFDFGLPPETLENVPMREGEDPHGKIDDQTIFPDLVDRFLREGVIDPGCDGPCDPV